MGGILSVPCRRRRRAAPVVISHPKPLSRSASEMTCMSSRPASTHGSRRMSGSRPRSQISVIFDDAATNGTATLASTPRHSKDSSHTMPSVCDVDHELGSQEQLSEHAQQAALRKSSSANSLASSLASQRANRSALPDVPEETAQVDAQLMVPDGTPPVDAGSQPSSGSPAPSSDASAAPAPQASHTMYHRVGAFRRRSRSTRPPTTSAYSHPSLHALAEPTLAEHAQSGWRQFAAQQKARRAAPHPYAPPEGSHVGISPPSALREVTGTRKRTRERPGHLRKVRRVEGYDWIRPEDLDGFADGVDDGRSTTSATPTSTPTPSLELTPSLSFQASITSSLCV